ncbi:MAG: hypothetical protein K2W95_13850 [Candidatus Obscuribacterales bacterium]|nr:hypothetical protein [Candidatus Obscuribacterales bacterium]
MMKHGSAAIIVDTGFSFESLQSARNNILAVIDARTGSVITGFPFISWEHNAEVVESFAGDPLNHGSMVLSALMKQAPELPVILIRAFDDAGKLIRTTFHDGKIVRPGWTEAYLTAVHICRVLGLCSVANLSFGGYVHAADGSGWESYCLSSVTGPGKPGHIVVAGAAAGNGHAIHASWRTDPGLTTEVSASQESSTTYNFWSAADNSSPQANDWLLEVFLDGKKLGEEFSANLVPNLWNNRKQVTIGVEGSGTVTIRTTRFWKADTRYCDLLALNVAGANSVGERPFHCAKPSIQPTPRKRVDNLRFDCWINQTNSGAKFLDHKDPMFIAEPAIFPNVIAVGLIGGLYSPDQGEPGAKPELLIEGDGPISFRLPEITAAIAKFLAEDSSLDVVQVRDIVTSQAA